MFRKVSLPEGVPGRLYLHSMPGRWEKLDEFMSEAERQAVDTIVCLAPEEEIKEKSPEYYCALSSGTFPLRRLEFPIRDFGVPGENRLDEFMNLVTSVAKMLRSGKIVLIHCASGVGRTGTLCMCVLFALGMLNEQAVIATRKAGADPETTEQKKLVFNYFQELKGLGIGSQ